ncbi:ferrochelatase [Rhodocytophaga aerolata]|uniref:Ferrochelatase n=1 Tax=Rhodocytophaga aerolata TaxID=455078 RepID=A0ABT8R254_9BACT|nr:ferrochelatase [Rhodocytophaga aerolata]MDO1444867.1 ferrochelatase [Rhodocytophaga aerolata]
MLASTSAIQTEQPSKKNFTPARPRTGVLLVNLGTPDSPSVPDVRKYLREFLMDGRVIDIPFISRFFLVNFIIAPFRAPKSAEVYRKLWTDKGSPLKIYGYEVASLLQQALGEEYLVSLGMRYQSPSIESALQELKDKGLDNIIVVPLFPQYASATTGSVHDKVMEIVRTWQIIPQINFINSFLQHPKFIETFALLGKKYIAEHPFDHYIFTYHGLPERQIRKGDATNTCLQGNCCGSLHALNQHCYRAQCFETSRLLAAALGITPDKYTVSFQSRLGKDPWIKPYTDDMISELAAKGVKRVLAFSPSFVSDCLETTIEVGEEYKELFEKKGGKHWQLVESLNNHPLWIETLTDIVHRNNVKA